MKRSLDRIIGISLLAAVLVGGCAGTATPGSATPGVPIAAPTRSGMAVTSRAETWPTLPDLVDGASLVVIATPNGRLDAEPPVANGPDHTRQIFEMRLQGVLKGDVDLATPIGVIDGVGVDPAADYPSGQLLSAKTSLLLFLRRFEYTPGVATDRWVLLGPEGAYVHLGGVLDDEVLEDTEIVDATFAGIPVESGLEKDHSASLMVAEVCDAVQSSGVAPGPVCEE